MGRIKEIVHRLVKRYRTNDPFCIAEKKDMLVLYSQLKDILGYHHTYKRVSVICIHSDLSDLERRFVCAHELGHAILHPKINTPFLRRSTLFSVDKIECEANTFAVELMMPDDVLSEHREAGLTVHQAAALYGIPSELVRLKSLR